jgi:hypothetical protein
VAATSNARRSDRKGAEFQARGQERRAGTVGDGVSAAFKAERCRRRPCRRSSRTRWLETARLSKRSRAARSLASAGPCGPGRRERSDRSRRATNGSGIADPPRGTKRSDCRVRAAVEASPAPCRAQRRAGANFGGRRRDGTQRSEVEERRRRRGYYRSAVSCGPLHRTHRRPARPLPTGRSASGGGSRARDRPEARRRSGARRAAWFIEDVAND